MSCQGVNRLVAIQLALASKSTNDEFNRVYNCRKSLVANRYSNISKLWLIKMIPRQDYSFFLIRKTPKRRSILSFLLNFL